MISLSASPSSYFSYAPYSGLMLAHILLMTIAWFFILPVGVMLSLSRSRLTLVTRLFFLGLNAIGILVGRIHNSKTPELYANNSHNRIGWVVTCIVLVQCLIGAMRTSPEPAKDHLAKLEERAALIPTSAEAMDWHQSSHISRTSQQYRYSHDSGHGTEPGSSRSHSISSLQGSEDEPLKSEETQDPELTARYQEKTRAVYPSTISQLLSRIHGVLPYRILRILSFFHEIADRVLLLLGFVAIVSGIVVYGGVFRGSNVFNGLAHTIKGGIFFWYGLLTLGRWMGCFVEYGWAWNVRPPMGLVSSRKATIPSAEFVESFVIFLYGSTNVFLEHLTAWGGAWTARDLEHVSISIMFFGGGLCGMLLESQWIRNLLNTTILNLPSRGHLNPPINRWDPPKTYPFSMNPFPALIILLLGLLMSSHHQSSMISTMIHKQWGTLFVGFAIARVFTYILIYISPPVSFLPSRPPTEIVASFCLISGGIIFMASNKDTVGAMEKHGLNPMFSFTLTMGFTAFLMAWTIIVLAIRGWAVQRQQSHSLALGADTA